MPSIQGVHHVALSVSDLQASVDFHRRFWDTEPDARMSDGPFQRAVFALPGGSRLGLTQHDEVAPEDFAPNRRGLDHLGFGVADRAALQQWAERLEDLGVPHSGLVEAEYGVALSFRDPDGIALEFFVPAG